MTDVSDPGRLDMYLPKPPDPLRYKFSFRPCSVVWRSVRAPVTRNTTDNRTWGTDLGPTTPRRPLPGRVPVLRGTRRPLVPACRSGGGG